MKKDDNIENVLAVCKPSGKGAFGSVMAFLCFVVVSIFCIIKGFDNHYQWLWLLFTLPISVLDFFAVRYDFFGEEQIGIDGGELIVKHLNGLPFGRDLRIPLLEIKEIGGYEKSKLQELLDALKELRGSSADESSIEIVTINGKTYHIGDNLSPRMVDSITRELIEQILKLNNVTK